jgi:hypothetical protein
VVDEMLRITAPGGPRHHHGTHWTRCRGRRTVRAYPPCSLGVGDDVIGWLEEHFDNGLPTVDELKVLLSPRTGRAAHRPRVLQPPALAVMHRAAMGDLPRLPREHLIHHLLWAPFAAVARRLHRPPCYRCLVVAQLRAKPAE